MKRRLLTITLAVTLAFATALLVFSQESQSSAIPDSCTVGDVDYDGV